jgi:hypothetical protein
MGCGSWIRCPLPATIRMRGGILVRMSRNDPACGSARQGAEPGTFGRSLAPAMRWLLLISKDGMPTLGSCSMEAVVSSAQKVCSVASRYDLGTYLLVMFSLFISFCDILVAPQWSSA